MRPEAETKTNYCETETETETKKVVSRPRLSRDLNISGISLLIQTTLPFANEL